MDKPLLSTSGHGVTTAKTNASDYNIPVAYICVNSA